MFPFFTWLSLRVWSRTKFILGFNFKLYRSSYNQHVVNLCFVADSYNTLVHQNQDYLKVCPRFFPLVVTENCSNQSPVGHLQHSSFSRSKYGGANLICCVFLYFPSALPVWLIVPTSQNQQWIISSLYVTLFTFGTLKESDGQKRSCRTAQTSCRWISRAGSPRSEWPCNYLLKYK